MPGNWEREIGGMLQGTGTAGRSFKRRPWLRMGCCANDDDDNDDDDAIQYSTQTRQRYDSNSSTGFIFILHVRKVNVKFAL
jgi:hypothetical protein